MGYVGEDIPKKLGYLVTISRKLQSPLSAVIISNSCAGKSKLMESLVDLVPEEDVVVYTRITPQALYYKEEKSLRHKLVVTSEEEGLFRADYSIRELISSKRLTLAAPIKDPNSGKRKTVEYEVEGPVSLLFSTTQPSIDYESQSRCFVISLDESIEQTKRIHQAQRESKTIEGILKAQEIERIKRVHKNVQRLLRRLVVANPYHQWLISRRAHE